MTEGSSTLPDLDENLPNSVFTSKLAPGADIGVGLVILSIVLLSISGNGLVLIISYRRRKKITGSELLCVNLAVVDFFCCVCFYPLSILSSFSHSWLGLHPTCTYYALGCYIFGLCGMFTIAAISVIRYLKTCYSLVYAWLDGANICLVCVGLWVIAALWSCLPLFGWGEYSPEPYGLSCTVAWSGYHTSTKDALYVICSFAVFTLVPVLLITVSQCQILLKICHFSQSLSARGIRTNLRRAERRLSMMFFCISLGFVVAWAPYAVVSFLFIFNKDLGNMDPVGFVLPALFAKSSHVYNPFIYFYFNKSFKQELCSLLQAVFPWMNGNRVGVRVSSAPQAPLAPQAPHPIQIQLQDKHQPLALKGSLGFTQDHSNSKQKNSIHSGLRLQGRVIYPCWIDEIRDSGSTLEHRPAQQSLPIPT